WAAGAMLGKYWSIFLLAGLAIAALADPRRREYFRSPAPWVTIAVGFAVLSPHLYWLAANDFPPLHYTMLSHSATSRIGAALSALVYVGETAAYLAVPIALVALAARPSPAALADVFWPKDQSRRTALLAFLLPILLPTLVTIPNRSAV